MKTILKRWTGKLIQSGSKGLLALALTFVIIGTVEINGSIMPKGDDPVPQVNWNASGG